MQMQKLNECRLTHARATLVEGPFRGLCGGGLRDQRPFRCKTIDFSAPNRDVAASACDQ